jgi:hypothetical protein
MLSKVSSTSKGGQSPKNMLTTSHCPGRNLIVLLLGIALGVAHSESRQHLSGLSIVSVQSNHPTRRGLSTSGRGFSVGSRRYRSGIGTHANSTVTVGLPSNTAVLRGQCGIDGSAGTAGSIRCQVRSTDGSVLFSSGALRGEQDAVSFSVDTKHLSQVVLEIDSPSDGIGYDHADWVNLETVPLPTDR